MGMEKTGNGYMAHYSLFMYRESCKAPEKTAEDDII
jgi:hypothetical protein